MSIYMCIEKKKRRDTDLDRVPQSHNIFSSSYNCNKICNTFYNKRLWYEEENIRNKM